MNIYDEIKTEIDRRASDPENKSVLIRSDPDEPAWNVNGIEFGWIGGLFQYLVEDMGFVGIDRKTVREACAMAVFYPKEGAVIFKDRKGGYSFKRGDLLFDVQVTS